MGIITSFFGIILNLIFEGVAMLTPVGTLGISIIVFTLVAQLLLTPLKMKQQRSMRAMSRIQPDLQKLQKKYANKKDQASQMEYSKEMQALYKKHNASPFAGCLPLIIQLPLIYGLYNVLRMPSRYINQLGQLYTEIAAMLEKVVGDAGTLIQQVLDQLPLGGNGMMEIQRLGEAAQVSDKLSHFTTEHWNILQSMVTPDQFNALSELLKQKHDFEWFLVNLIDSPAQLFASGVMLALLIPVISGASTFIFSKITMAASKATQPTNPDMPNSADSMMKVMNIMMPVMMGFISWTVPTGLALYWVAGNIIMMFQQIIVNKIVEKQEKVVEEKLAAERAAAAAAAPKKKKKKKKPPVEGETTGDTHKETEEKPKKQPKEVTTGDSQEKPKAKKSDNTKQD